MREEQDKKDWAKAAESRGVNQGDDDPFFIKRVIEEQFKIFDKGGTPDIVSSILRKVLGLEGGEPSTGDKANPLSMDPSPPKESKMRPGSSRLHRILPESKLGTQRRQSVVDSAGYDSRSGLVDMRGFEERDPEGFNKAMAESLAEVEENRKLRMQQREEWLAKAPRSNKNNLPLKSKVDENALKESEANAALSQLELENNRKLRKAEYEELQTRIKKSKKVGASCPF